MGASAHLRPRRGREGLGRTVARRPALGISQTSRAVRERRVERLLWRIVGRDEKVDRRRAERLLNRSFGSTS